MGNEVPNTKPQILLWFDASNNTQNANKSSAVLSTWDKQHHLQNNKASAALRCKMEHIRMKSKLNHATVNASHRITGVSKQGIQNNNHGDTRKLECEPSSFKKP